MQEIETIFKVSIREDGTLVWRIAEGLDEELLSLLLVELEIAKSELLKKIKRDTETSVDIMHQ